MLKSKIEYTPGQRMQKMVFIGEVESDKDRKAMFICTCGKIFTAWIHSVKSNVTKSCGCFRSEMMKNRQTKHGLSRHPLYNVWTNMIERCFTKTNNCYHRYGGRGVTVCDSWKKDFGSFYNWCISNGWTKNVQLDKDSIGDGKLYSPETCTFVTPKQNSNMRHTNRILVCGDVSMTLAEWADKIGIGQSTIHARLKRGWGVEKSLNTPLNHKK